MPLFRITSGWLKGLTSGGRPLRTMGEGILLAAAVGLVAGLGALVFHALTQTVVYLTLESLAGYEAGGPLGEAEFFAETERHLRPWMLLLVLTGGGLLSGWLVYRFAPEAEGHGTDAAIDAYHNRRGLIRPVVPLVKMLASAITLGTGGSGGREGPIAQTGAGFGSYLATKLRLSDHERRVLLSAGVGAGIAAIFQAPLAGAIFAVEVLYRDPDFESEGLIPAFIATAIAYCVFNFTLSVTGFFEGFGHLFHVQEGIRFREPLLLIPLTVMVVVMVAASWLYVKTFYTTQAMFKRLPLSNWLKPAAGALATGLVALILYYGMAPLGDDAQHGALSVLAFGYGFLQDTLVDSSENLTVAVLLAVGLGKMVTTSLTIGSGGSGGVFGPSMVIGGSLGAVVGLLFHELMPAVRVDVFVILGMAGFFAAAAKTPVSTLIMVTELTGSYELLLPAMWVCALAYVFSRGWSIYREQVPTRLDSPAHRGDFVIDVLQGLTIRDAMGSGARKFTTVPLDMPLSEVVQLITGTNQTCFPVVDNENHYYGLFSINDVRQFLYDSDLGSLAVAHDLATPGDLTLKPDMDLGTAIQRFASGRFEELPVVDAEESERVTGMLRRQDVIAAYNAQLMRMRTGGGEQAAEAEATTSSTSTGAP